MISLKVLDVKGFMSSLLIHTIFDEFLACEMELSTFVNFTIEGRLNRDWYSGEELEAKEEYALWKDIKPFAYQMMKGNKTPSGFRIVLQYPPEQVSVLLEEGAVGIRQEEIAGLYLHMRFEHKELHLITGTSVKTFTLDKSLDHEWDRYVKEFLKKCGIAIEEE